MEESGGERRAAGAGTDPAGCPGIQDTGRQPHFRDIEAFLPTKHESDDIFTFVMMFERFLELNGVERGVMGTVITRAIESKGTANIYEVVTRTVAL